MYRQNKYVIAKCPNCQKPLMYSDNPLDRITTKVFIVSEDYHGKTQLCAKCKRMYAVIEQAPQYDNTAHV